jgi:hypothetical protein
MRFKQVKLVLAAIGAGAAVTMGVLAVSAGDEVVPGTLVSDPSATLGETVTVHIHHAVGLCRSALRWRLVTAA